ncbi:MAG: hypothetical protein IKP74_06250 [Clostridia bacterium]|nr:hypothetical protein [Clostridia bacterium]
MGKKKKKATSDPASGETAPETEEKQKKKKRRWHFGDRYEGRRLRTLAPMQYVIPYIMKVRADSQNHFEDRIDMDILDAYCKKKQAEGLSGFGALHAILAAYVRTISERPAVNRFVAGQHVYARKNIVANMTIKKKMGLDCPDTVIKVIFDPADTADDVYRKFKEIADKATSDDTDFDNTAGFLRHIPGLILRGVIGFLRFLDYFGLLPRGLVKVSPFHGSLVITSMGSLGINAIYHHLYDFGNIPLFFAYGKKYTVNELQPDGTVVPRRYVDLRAVTDERICDGYYYASAFKILQRYLSHPELLDTPPAEVKEDID